MPPTSTEKEMMDEHMSGRLLGAMGLSREDVIEAAKGAGVPAPMPMAMEYYVLAGEDVLLMAEVDDIEVWAGTQALFAWRDGNLWWLA